MTTWHEASAQFKAGDKVEFATDFDIYPDVFIPAGTTATIVENSLNELGCQLILMADNEAITCALAEWDGEIWLAPPLITGTSKLAWQDQCPLTRA